MNLVKRLSAISYAMKFTGTFYKYGGDDPSGFDCSGFMVEILKSVGLIPRGSDFTAQGLYDKFNKVDSPGTGILAFWKNKKGDKINHVELCINSWQTIGASGGDSNTKTIESAIRKNAYIKIRPTREGAIYADPFIN